MLEESAAEPDLNTRVSNIAQRSTPAGTGVGVATAASGDYATASATGSGDNADAPIEARPKAKPPRPEEMTEIRSLVAQLLGKDSPTINAAPTINISGLQRLTPPQADIVNRAEDATHACAALARRSMLAVSLLRGESGIDGVAIGAADRTAYFDIKRLGHWPETLRDLLRGPVPKIIHNLDHPARELTERAGIEPSNLIDLYAAAVLSDGYTHDRTCDNYGLDALVAHILRRSLPSCGEPAARRVHEVGAMISLHARLLDQVKRADVESVWRRENDVVVPLAAVEARGFALDVEKSKTLHDRWERHRQAAAARLRPILGETNLDSQDELRAALGTICGFAFTTTSKLHLRRLAGAHPFLRDVLVFREASINVQNLEAWLKAVDGNRRAHATFDALSAATGRMGCSNPALQSAPRVLRECWVAPPGKVLVIVDYAAIELAIIAHHTQDAEMMACFRRNIDLHRRTGSFLVGKKMEEVTDGERTGAKAINFGFSYAMGVSTFLEHAEENYGLVLEEAAGKTARARFFKLYPGIAAWHEEVRREGPNNLDLRTPSGRLRRFGEFDFPAFVNTPIQGVGACGFKRALTLLHSVLQPIDASIVHVQHDEIVVEAPSNLAAEASVTTEEAMIQAMSEFVTSVPVRVKATIAATWAKP